MKKKIVVRIFILLLLCAQIWTMYITFTYPVSVIVVERDASNAWVIQRFDPDNLSIQNEVQIGDRILKVNDRDVNDYFSIVKWRTVDQYNELTIERNGQITRIPAKKIVGAINGYLLSLVGEIVSLSAAFLLFRKLPNLLSARHLSFVFTCMGIIFLSLGASIRGDPLGKATIFVAMVLLPVLLLQFLMILIDEKASTRLFSTLYKVLYSMVAIVFLLALGLFTHSPITYFIYRVELTLVLLFFTFGIVMNLGFLTFMYIKHRSQNSYVAVLIKTIWVSLFISFAPITLLSFIPKLLFGYELLHSFYMSWFIFVLPITFAYLIAAKRLYDIDMLMRRIILTTAVSLIPCILFVGAVRILFLHEAAVSDLIIIFSMLLTSMTVILYSFEHLTTRLQPILFPRKHQLQVALKKIANKLRAISSFHDLKDIILVDIVSTLQVYGAAIVFKYNDSVETISEGDIDIGKVENLVNSEPFRDTDYALIEINRHEEYTSYLVISSKITGTMLGTEELQWLNLIIPYLAVSLENLYLIRKLTMKLEQLAMQIQNEDAATQLIWFRKMMFDLQERERTRIATDLHDTTMQDLFFLKGRLHTLLEKYAYSAADRKQLESLLDYIDIINVNLRQSCFELHPYMLKEIGLVKTIERLVEFEAPISTFELSFRAGGVDIIERKDLESKRHMFRMVQELINNAKKHANASRIRMMLTATPTSIYFEYEDDGVGFDAKRAGVSGIGASGMGMDQMKSRIFSLNGQFELQTGKGKGVKIAATIPVQEGLTA